MNAGTWIERIRNGKLDQKFKQLYGAAELNSQVERYCSLLGKMAQVYPDSDVIFVSTSGRTEISGNHTDHNRGKVIAAGVHLDSVAVVAPNESNLVTLVSEGYNNPFVVDLGVLEVQPKETNQTHSLIRGIAARLTKQNHKVGGLHGFITSQVLPGSGLSSSAAIEVLIANIFNHLYNDGKIARLELAQAGQYAENRYFGKPCGLMDQIACAFGGIAAIDFKDLAAVKVEHFSFDFQEKGYTLVVVDSGDTHANLTQAYAQIPVEMNALARELGKTNCREVEYNEFLHKLPEIRESAGDRAILRYLHFHNENIRVEKQIEALKNGDIRTFLQLVNESGSSSWRLLQNCYEPADPFHQGVSLALGLTMEFLKGDGACRVHGGGFAGTIQAYIPNRLLAQYIQYMSPVFGEEAVIPLRIRPEGTVMLSSE